jgi:hypothetical protein
VCLFARLMRLTGCEQERHPIRLYGRSQES